MLYEKSYKELYNKQKVIKSYIKLYKEGRASFKVQRNIVQCLYNVVLAVV